MSAPNHISPFRYPGGKSWFIPFFKNWLNSAELVVEPFAGGASVSLACLASGVCKHAILVEADPNVAAVWKTILGRNSNWLIEKIRRFDVTEKSVEKELSETTVNTRQRAWQTLLLNRVSHGGIVAKGAGRIRKGEDNKGLSSRWYPQTLVRRIEMIHEMRAKISFRHGDGMEFLKGWAHAEEDGNAALLVDPPYPVAGRRLYDHWDINHETLFSHLGAIDGRFIATYENLPDIKRLAAKHGLRTRVVSMRSRQHASKKELLVSSQFAN